MIGCDVKYDPRARETGNTGGGCDEHRRPVLDQVHNEHYYSGTKEWAIRNHRNKHKHTTPMFQA